MSTKNSKSHKSIKHAIIDKANNRTVIAVAVATFIVFFSGFATKALFSQSFYHGRLISEKEKALDQLEENQETLKSLELSYTAFLSETENILGGNPSGDGPLDGNNTKLVLDALPSEYDYPALSSSFEKLLKDGGYKINAIGGSEDESFASTNEESTGNVVPIPIPYSFSYTANAQKSEEFLQILERSIRPMYIDTLKIQVGDNSITTLISLHTFFTQSKTFELGSKEVM